MDWSLSEGPLVGHTLLFTFAAHLTAAASFRVPPAWSPAALYVYALVLCACQFRVLQVAQGAVTGYGVFVAAPLR